MDSAAITLWVKKEGDASWAEVTVDSTISVARMIEEIVRKLPSLQGKDLSTLTLHVAAYKVGKDLGAALDSRTTVAAAGLEDGASIVITATGVATSAVRAAAAGACLFHLFSQPAGPAAVGRDVCCFILPPCHPSHFRTPLQRLSR